MKDRILAQRYANSAVTFINEENYSSLLEDCYAIIELYDSNEDIKKIITSRILNAEKKRQVLSLLVEDSEQKEFWNSYFKIIISKKREYILKTIIEEMISCLYEEQNKRFVTLYLARETDEKTLHSILKELGSVLKKEVECKIIIKPDLIGGFIAQTEDILIDGSVSGNLNRFIVQAIKSK